ncbi:MAG: hypothetical protein G8D28_06615 [gamma proteobacterium symbiont of Phacoides pectinatus]
MSALTLLLAEAANSSSDADTHLHLSESDRYELEIAGRLHDCGKITTPDHLLNKSTKLDTRFDRIQVIGLRAELIRRDMQLAYLERRTGVDDADGALQRAHDRDMAALDDDLEFLRRINVGGEFLDQETLQRIHRVGQRRWRDGDGQTHPFLNDDEIDLLSIRKGTLSEREREKINQHANASTLMLKGLRFPAYLRHAPEYAGGHHEHVDGSGYPNGLTREQLSIPARIMAIADVFEAITAHDRPYRDPIMLSQALQIICRMAQGGHLDLKLVQRKRPMIGPIAPQISPCQ